MTKTYRPREYHNAPLCVIELEDGGKWTVRFPKGSDLDLLAEIRDAQTARLRAYVEDRRAEADRIGAEAEEHGEDRDAAARAYLSSLPDMDPGDIRKEYLHAEVIAAFIREAPSAAEVLDRLSNEYSLDFLYERHEEIMQAISGEAAKKRLRR